MAKPHLRAAILDKLSRQIAGAARIAQKRILKEFGPGTYVDIFGLSDQLLHTLGNELKSLAQDGLQSDAFAARDGAHGFSSSETSTPEHDSHSSTEGQQNDDHRISESRIQELLDDRLQKCIRPELELELRKELGLPVPVDSKPPLHKRLRRNVGAHPRGHAAKEIVSEMTSRQLKQAQKLQSKTDRYECDQVAHSSFVQRFKEAQRAFDVATGEARPDNASCRLIAQMVIEGIKDSFDGGPQHRCLSHCHIDTAEQTLVAPGLWSSPRPSAPEFIPSALDSPSDGKEQSEKPGHIESHTALFDRFTADVQDAGIQADIIRESREKQAQTTFTGCFGSTIALIDRATQVDSSISAFGACDKSIIVYCDGAEHETKPSDVLGSACEKSDPTSYYDANWQADSQADTITNLGVSCETSGDSVSSRVVTYNCSTAEPPSFELARLLISRKTNENQVSLLEVAAGIQQYMFHENPHRVEACALHQQLSDVFL